MGDANHRWQGSGIAFEGLIRVVKDMMKDCRSLFLMLYILSLFSCKYEDGPAFSLRSKRQRVIHQWQIERAFESGTDQTEYYNQKLYAYVLEFDRDHAYKILYGSSSEDGIWAFNSQKTVIRLSPNSSYTNLKDRELKILRLKEKELWLLDSFYGKQVTLHLH